MTTSNDLSYTSKYQVVFVYQGFRWQGGSISRWVKMIRGASHKHFSACTALSERETERRTVPSVFIWVSHSFFFEGEFLVDRKFLINWWRHPGRSHVRQLLSGNIQTLSFGKIWPIRNSGHLVPLSVSLSHWSKIPGRPRWRHPARGHVAHSGKIHKISFFRNKWPIIRKYWGYFFSLSLSLSNYTRLPT